MLSNSVRSLPIRLGGLAVGLAMVLAMPMRTHAFQQPFDLLEFDEETMIRHELQNPEARLFSIGTITLYLDLKIDQMRYQIEQDELQMQMMMDELAKVQAELREHEARRAEVYKSIRQIRVHAESVPQSIQQLEKMRAELKIELAGAEARRAGISLEVESIMKQIAENKVQDPVLEQLTRLHELRMLDLNRIKMLRDQGVISESEIGNAMTAVAEAELRVIEREQELTQTNGDSYITTLRTDLVSVTMDIAELKAKMVSIDEQLSQLYEAEELLQELPSGLDLLHESALKRSISMDEEVSRIRFAHLKAKLKLRSIEGLRDGYEKLEQERLESSKEAEKDDDSSEG